MQAHYVCVMINVKYKYNENLGQNAKIFTLFSIRGQCIIDRINAKSMVSNNWMMLVSNDRIILLVLLIVVNTIAQTKRESRANLSVQVQIMKIVLFLNAPTFLDLLWGYYNNYSTTLMLARGLIYESVCYNSELLIRCLSMHRIQSRTLYCP